MHRLWPRTDTVLLAASLCGCGGPRRDGPSHIVPEQGVQALDNPTTGYAPGTIYRRTPSGVVFIVTKKLIPYLTPDTSDESLPEYSSFQTRRASTGGLLALLFGGAFKAGAAHAREITTRERLYDAKKESVEDVDLEYALIVFNGCPGHGSSIDSSVQAHFGGKVECPPPIRWPKKEPGDRYYIVRETVSGDSIDYRLDDSAVTALGGEAALREQVAKFDAGELPAVSWRNNQSLTLTRRFPMRQRVYMKAQEVAFQFLNCRACMSVDEAVLEETVEEISSAESVQPAPELEPAPPGYTPAMDRK